MIENAVRKQDPTEFSADSFARRAVPELEDFSWLPRWWRDGMTDFLEFLESAVGAYDGATPLLDRLIRTTRSTRLIDFGSGAAGPSVELYRKLSRAYPELSLVLTDRFPHEAARRRVHDEAERAGWAIRYDGRPIDMQHPPDDLSGLRTIFTAFHHLDPTAARAVIERAVRDRCPLAIFEVTGRSAAHAVMSALIPFLVLAGTPFVRPRTLGRFAATYLAPFIPLGCLWDGMASNLRTYSTPDLELLCSGFESEPYSFEIGRFPVIGPLRGTYLLGSPADAGNIRVAAR